MRIYGLDLLKILSAIMIIILHVLGRGGILYNTMPFSLNYEIAWMLEIGCYCAVNCYALISGYVLSEKEIKYNKIIKTWFQIVFYTVCISLVFYILDPSMISIKSIMKSVLPIYSGQYWYFTSYVGMFFCIPFLNHIIQTIEHRQLKKIFFIYGILFSIIPTILMGKFDPFYLNNGYSMLWLIVLYLLGAYCQKYNIAYKYEKKRLLLGYFSCIFITWLIKLIIEIITFNMFGKIVLGNVLITYISPTIVLSSIFIFLFFINLRIEKKLILKVIKFLTPLTFGIYLIHSNPLIYTNILNDLFISYVDYPYYVLIIIIIIGVFTIFIICILIDKAKL